MHNHTNLTSETEGPHRVPSGALHGAPAGAEAAAQRPFPASPFFTPRRCCTGNRR